MSDLWLLFVLGVICVIFGYFLRDKSKLDKNTNALCGLMRAMGVAVMLLAVVVWLGS